MKTVLLIGAGATRAAAGSRARRALPPLDADFFDIAGLREKALQERVVGCLRELVGDYSEALTGSLETATTYLYLKALDSKRDSIYHRGFLDLLGLLSGVLAGTTNSLKVGPTSLIYRFLLSELRKCERPEDLTVLTFNYDLLIERALEAISQHGRSGVFKFPGCYRLQRYTGPIGITGQAGFESRGREATGVAVLKLHGSMNWQSSHNSISPTPSAMFNPARKLHIVDSPEIAPSLSKRIKRRMYMKPVLVPPISGKRGMMHQSMSRVWRSAAQALSEADRIVVVGYSCPPLDLEARILISENVRFNDSKRLYVIDPNPVTGARFVEICGVDHVTIYSSINSWVRDAQS